MPFWYASRQNADIQRIAPKRIRRERDGITCLRPQLPIDFATIVVDRHTVDGGIRLRRQAQIQRQTVQRIQSLQITLQGFFFRKIS